MNKTEVEQIIKNANNSIKECENQIVKLEMVKAIDAAIELIKGKGNKLEVLGNLAALEMIKDTQHELQALREERKDERD